MPEDIAKSRMEELEETVKNLSQKVETLWNENMILYEKSKKSDTWVFQLIGCCKEMVNRVDALEKRCSTLAGELELQSLLLDALSMNTREEEKSLNSHGIISEMHQIQLEAPYLPGLFSPVQKSESTATIKVQEAPQLEPTGRKRKAQEMAESGPGTSSPVSSSYSGPITFLNTFSDEVPTKRSARDPVRRAGRPKAKEQLMTPPAEPAGEQQQVLEEEVLATEEQQTEAIKILFESSSCETFELRCDDSDYDLFRGGNWVC